MKTHPKWVRAPETTNLISEYLVIIRELGLRSRFFSRISGFYPEIFLAVETVFPNTFRLCDDRQQIVAVSQGCFFRRDDIQVVIAVCDDDWCDDFIACFLDKVDIEFQQ